MIIEELLLGMVDIVGIETLRILFVELILELERFEEVVDFHPFEDVVSIFVLKRNHKVLNKSISQKIFLSRGDDKADL